MYATPQHIDADSAGATGNVRAGKWLQKTPKTSAGK